jgi:uncharacterized protein YqfA (UPF0365 family)
MGGAVAPIVKPIAKVTDKVIGTDLSGQKAQAQTQQAQAQVQQAQAKVAEMQAEKVAEAASPMQASRAEEQAGSRLRGARRRGRQLLSDARLNAEAGIQTLGGGNNLG